MWFQPRCDPITGHWSPVQCLGKQPTNNDIVTTSSQAEGISRAFITSPSAPELTMPATPYGVCWCADKKGAPLKGTLTRDIEPVCNSRQARRRSSFDDNDPLMENLIRQMTMLVDVDNYLGDEFEISMLNDDEDVENSKFIDSMAVESRTKQIEAKTVTIPASAPAISVTERVLELANSLLDSQLSIESNLKPLTLRTTRCRAMVETAPFPVSCDADGAFLPTQCNGKFCWCVDAAGNQLDSTNMFRSGSKNCQQTAIGAVAIELHMQNRTAKNLRNVYDTIRMELHQLIGDALENLRVQENLDGTVTVRFELHNEHKVDLAFAIETAIIEGNFQLASGQFKPDITRSHFIHRNVLSPLAQAATSPENTIHLVVFIMATSSAFLVSVFVVYIMLKRGKRKVLPNYGYPEYVQNKIIGSGDKVVDYTSPIFVLSAAHHHDDSIKSNYHVGDVKPQK